MLTMEWEQLPLPKGRLPGVGNMTQYLKLYRTPVPGGWLVMLLNDSGAGVNPSITFYPDPEYLWGRDERTELEASEPGPGVSS